ncbi:efflux RND transporter permease subunit [Pantanalinema sp. GBBB05]|uniref:efflux RND transporter permease subunit n=1 Tax=Pantanalinema sp. GBBB05 TaxID=2604139 RepID=UPI001DC33DE8|nr:efflux RND transporter permease subunit [Pantanalinema sp. GBBB05]
MTTPQRSPSMRERFNISRLALRYPWLTLGFWLAISIAGILAFSSLKYALFPDVTFPVVVVNATAPITNASGMEAKVTQPIERQLKSLDKQGLDTVRSTTYPGRAIISLSFSVGSNLETSRDRVETVLKQVSLPTGSSYEITPINLNESAVVSYAVTSPQESLAELTTTVQSKILPTIAEVPGVLKATLLGVPADAQVKELPPANTQRGEEVIQAAGSSAVRFNGKDALAIEVVKRSDANTLEVVSEVEKTIAWLQSSLPNLKLTQATTQADYIDEATHATIEALVGAVILSVIVIYPFLWNWKATLISALAIPTSLWGTAIIMAMLGLNLETITLLALALVIGIIVDDAIVDVENIARHIEEGEPPRQAAISATDEIGLTVTSATLTIAAVFLPVAFMGNVVGQFFKPFGIVVSASVLISLLVARTLSPLLAAYWLKPRRHQTNQGTPQSGNFSHLYYRLLAWSLRHRWLVMGIAVLSLVLGIALIPLLPKGFIPKLDRGEFNVTYTAPLPQLPMMPPDMAGQLPSGTTPPTGLPTAQVPPGGAPQLPLGSTAPENAGAANGQAGLPPGIDPASLMAGKFPIVNPLNDSLKVAKQLESTIQKSPEVQSVFTAVGTRQQPNKGTLYVRLNHDRKQHTTEVQDQIRQQLPTIPDVTTSVEDIQFVDTGGEKPLQVALLGNNPVTLSQTAAKIQDRVAALPGFADVTITGEANKQGKVAEITRLNSRRVAYISANLTGTLALGDATNQVVKIANEVKPADVTLDLGGDSARAGEVFGSFGMTLTLSVLSVLLVLVLLFRSWTDPLVIVISLPLSIVGAIFALLVTQSDFGMISVIGIIFLLGLTNKSAILLVDYVNQLRQGGMSRTDAILKAGPVRLRPILMTTAATILGMLPIALGWGAGAELRAPMAIAIIGGLITSTLLSLIVVPVLYALLDDVRSRSQKIV